MFKYLNKSKAKKSILSPNYYQINNHIPIKISLVDNFEALSLKKNGFISSSYHKGNRQTKIIF